LVHQRLKTDFPAPAHPGELLWEHGSTPTPPTPIPKLQAPSSTEMHSWNILFIGLSKNNSETVVI